MEKDLVSLIVGTLDELREQEEVAVLVAIDEDAPLFGRNGLLDSLGLVTLIVALEQKIEDKYAVSVALADERALSQRKSPFRTVGALAEYAGGLIRAEQGDG